MILRSESLEEIICFKKFPWDASFAFLNNDKEIVVGSKTKDPGEQRKFGEAVLTTFNVKTGAKVNVMPIPKAPRNISNLLPPRIFYWQSTIMKFLICSRTPKVKIAQTLVFERRGVFKLNCRRLPFKRFPLSPANEESHGLYKPHMGLSLGHRAKESSVQVHGRRKNTLHRPCFLADLQAVRHWQHLAQDQPGNIMVFDLPPE